MKLAAAIFAIGLFLLLVTAWLAGCETADGCGMDWLWQFMWLPR